MQTLHGKQLATIEVPFDGGDGEEPHTIDRLLSYAYRPDREVRRARARRPLHARSSRAPTCSRPAYDAIVGDRLSTDRLRGYPDPMAATHLMNELDGAVVETMMAAIEEHYPVAQRWFRTKAQLLGIEDSGSRPVRAARRSREFLWPEAVEIVDRTFRRFSPQLAEIFNACIERNHVDAEPRAGKIGGAYCSSIAKDVLPYVLMNYTDRLTDVMTLAHEFGHGSHFALALRAPGVPGAPQRARDRRGSLDLRAAARFDYLFDREDDAATKAALVADVAEGAMPTVFRQTVLARFEQRAYALRAEGKALTASGCRSSGSPRTGATTATRSRCRRATGSAGRTSRTSSTRASTPTPTRSRTS